MYKKIIAICVILVLAMVATITGIILYFYNIYNAVPTISLIGNENITLELNESYNEQGVQAFLDKVDISSNVQIEGKVDTNKTGEYKLKYTVFNSKNRNPVSVERIVNIEDRIAPTITLKGKNEVTVYVGDTYKDDGCIAQDNYDGDITNKVTITGEVNTKKAGTYTINFAVQDEAGNKAETTRKVIVKNRVVSTKRGLPVLMYHFFYDASKGEKARDNNWMEVSAFEEQMKYLSENNFYFPSWSEVEAYVKGTKTLPAKSVVITIDDGDQSFIKYAIPIIEKYNVKATSFVVTSWNGNWVPKTYKSSHLDFESHSHNMHRSGGNGKGRLVNISYNEALEDVTKSKNIIGDCTVFCYPFGHYNDTAKKALKDSGYKLAFTTKGGRVYPGQDKFELPRVRMSKGISMSAFKQAVQ